MRPAKLGHPSTPRPVLELESRLHVTYRFLFTHPQGLPQLLIPVEQRLPALHPLCPLYDVILLCSIYSPLRTHLHLLVL